ncbi:MAG: outer membrane lipid asymmetry maintenance protein MlaD [Gammaproteobacteria bacterium]|nr:outer membrane lipid asymmetry maintenance protein MlaD [Gammaproteobacteria bacterium]
MISRRVLEFWVGLFILAGLVALILLAFRVSGLTQIGNNEHYILTAEFDNIGNLKVRAPVAVAGVKIGQVASINLDPQSYRAKVTLFIDRHNKIPLDTSASILTQGLLGSNYISLLPGFAPENLKAGQMIQTTHSALILENLVGQLMFNLTNKSSDKDGDTKPKSSNKSKEPMV